MGQRFHRTLQWLRQRAQRYDLFGQYIRALYHNWHNYLWEALLPAPIIVWWMVDSPPMWIVTMTFLWAFLTAGYFTWREERAKNSTQSFRAWISDMAYIQPPDAGPCRLFVGVSIANVGAPASIPTWFASFKNAGGSRTHLSDRMFVEDPTVQPPSNMHGSNLRLDDRLIATGETRRGWLAFDVDRLTSTDDAVRILETVILGFDDAFGKHQEIGTLASWFHRLQEQHRS